MTASIVPLHIIFGIPDLNLPPTTIDYRPCPHKRALHTPDLLPAAISVTSENYFIAMTTLFYSSDILPSDDYNPLHVMKKYEKGEKRIPMQETLRRKILQKEKVLQLHLL